MADEVEYFDNKRPDRTYISRKIDPAEKGKEVLGVLSDREKARTFRFISKVFDVDELHEFAKVEEEIVIRRTSKARQEVKAIFYEDNRDIKSLTIQRFDGEPGSPRKKTHFTFTGEEIEQLQNFISLIRYVHLGTDSKITIDDNVLSQLPFSSDDKKKLFSDNMELVEEFVRNDLTKKDIISIAYRKKQLDIFEQLLSDDNFFEEKEREWQRRGKEAVWQYFFEKNPWIFGYGLSYIFTSQLDSKRLEQITTGVSINQFGKRVDALMKTKGLISSLCFVEIKTHKTNLLFHNKPYRRGCWRISDELAGSVSQIQKTVQTAVKSIQTRMQFEDEKGELTGETVFLYQPKSYVVIGDLSEFLTENGVNEQKFSSFELFRRNIQSPEIITFDELFERAKFIVQYSENEASLL